MSPSPATQRQHAGSDATEHCVRAPERLVMEHRTPFRETAIAGVHDAARAGSRVLALDLSSTSEIDAAGLGVLVVVQSRAKEKGLAVRLRGVSDRLGALLRLTKLDQLFAIEMAR